MIEFLTFFHPVNTYSNTGKTAKGKELQEVAKKFERVLVAGANAAQDLTHRLQDIAAILDAKYPRTRRTAVKIHIDGDGCGQITACPMKDGLPLTDELFFSIWFDAVDLYLTKFEFADILGLEAIGKGGDK